MESNKLIQGGTGCFKILPTIFSLLQKFPCMASCCFQGPKLTTGYAGGVASPWSGM